MLSGNLPKPIKRQREVLYLPTTGHSAVLGAAGSGKTTLALYRAAYLSEPSMPHAGKTLILTYNNALVTYLNHLKSGELRKVKIKTYHKFARDYLKRREKMPPNCICDSGRPGYIEQAKQAVASGHKPSDLFNRPIEFFMDEIQWIFSHGITSCETYVDTTRVGRFDTRLHKEQRPIMYEILEKYKEIRHSKGFEYDWDDIALNARREFEKDTSGREYTHIIIDEGQDFSPEMIRSLAAAIPEGGSLSFFGDVAQQIYGQRMSWRSAGLNIGEVWHFKENYRNTKQIAKLGLAISEMPFFKGIPDVVEPTSTRADGALPTLVKCNNETQQTEFILKKAKEFAGTQNVAILVKKWEQAKIFINKPGIEPTCLHRELDKWKAGPGIYYGTYHSAKGLEFDSVILPFLDSDNMPDKKYIVSHDDDEARTYYGKLLYVAVTRAKTNLVLLYSDELTQLLPTDNALYHKVRL